MRKLMVVTFVICALLFCNGSAESAAVKPVSGSWLVGGSASITASLPNYCILSLTLPNVKLLEDQFHFQSGIFTDDKLGMEGTYTTKPNGSFVVNLKDWIADLEATLEDLISSNTDYNINIVVTKKIFAGQVVSAKKITGNFEVDLVIYKLGAVKPTKLGTVIIKGNLSGTPAPPNPTDLSAGGGAVSPNSISGFLAETILFTLRNLSTQ